MCAACHPACLHHARVVALLALVPVVKHMQYAVLNPVRIFMPGTHLLRRRRLCNRGHHCWLHDWLRHRLLLRHCSCWCGRGGHRRLNVLLRDRLLWFGRSHML